MDGEQPYVFISYSRTDQAYVDRIVEHFARNGVRTWIDRHTDYGQRWPTVIRERVDGCAALVVVMSPAAEGSPWVEREIHRAESVGKPILPLLLSGPRFFMLATVQHEDVTGGKLPSAAFADNLRRLIGQCAMELAPSTPPIAPPTSLPVTAPDLERIPAEHKTAHQSKGPHQRYYSAVIACSNFDRAIAEQLRADLVGAGASVDLRSYSRPETPVLAIEPTTTRLIVLASESFLKTSWITSYDVAEQIVYKPIVTVNLDGYLWTDAVPWGLTTLALRQAPRVDLRQWPDPESYAAALDQVLAVLTVA